MLVAGMMVVKNMEKWVYYAVKSLNFLDKFFIIDNGSTDRTVSEIQRAGVEPEIVCEPDTTLLELRNRIIDRCQSYDWVWWADGDEVWPSSSCSEALAEMQKYVRDDSISILQPKNIRFIGDRFRAEDAFAAHMPRIFKPKRVRMYGKSFPYAQDALAEKAEHLDPFYGLHTTEVRVDRPYVVNINASFHHYTCCNTYLERFGKWFRYIASSHPDESFEQIMERMKTQDWGVREKSTEYHGVIPGVFEAC